MHSLPRVPFRNNPKKKGHLYLVEDKRPPPDLTSKKMAYDLYGTRVGQLAFVIGCGPSIQKAQKYLMDPHPHSLRIAINAAIEEIPAEYWIFIDLAAYERSKDHPNAKAAIQVGVDHFADKYSQEVYVWERALELPKDTERILDCSDCLGFKTREGQKCARCGGHGKIGAPKIVHYATSLIAAINFAALMGVVRIITVGCDHQVSQDYINAKMVIDPSKNWRSVYDFTFNRINIGLNEKDFWLPSWVSLADASVSPLEMGGLPIPRTQIPGEFKMLDDAFSLMASGKMKMVLDGNTVRPKD